MNAAPPFRAASTPVAGGWYAPDDPRLDALLREGECEAVDVELALALTALVPSPGDAEVRLAIALTSRAVRDGHTCLRLDALAPPTGWAARTALPWPTPEAVRAALDTSPLVAVPDQADGGLAPRRHPPGDQRHRIEVRGDTPASGVTLGTAPLVRRGHQLYLQRFDALEARLAAAARGRLARPPFPVDPEDAGRLATLFPDRGEDSAQHDAAALALTASLVIITGGPGTGKTFTVLRLLAALLARTADGPLPEILLLAPTGKAASRLSESVRGGLAHLAPGLLDNTRRAAIPASADTIHRALGLHPDHPHRPRHHAGNPLPADIVIVDETSMVDLPLMARLFEAVREDARLVLLGDADQLASVDAGAVLRDLVEAPVLAPRVVTLVQSRRFHGESALGALVFALRRSDRAALRAALRGASPEVEWRAEPAEVVPASVLEALRAHRTRLAAAGSPEEALAELGRWRLLTALRRGPTGADAINAQLLAEQGGHLERGTPVLVVQNAPDDRLANGDLGVAWVDADGRPVVLFPGDAGPRTVGVRRLPRWEPAFAMTVHKAQGSEFEAVTVLLPAAGSPVLTRELVYTAVSRARTQVTLIAPNGAIEAALTARAARATGLGARLAP